MAVKVKRRRRAAVKSQSYFYKVEEESVEDFIGQFLFGKENELPERNMLAAFLERAVKDYRRENRRASDNPAMYRQVEYWIFFECSQERFSFIWTCNHLGLCPLEVRRRLIREGQNT